MNKSQQLNITKISIAIATTLLTSSLIVGLRGRGFFEQVELLSYDYLIRADASEEPDPRLLLVAIDDAALQKLNSDKISDRDLTKTIQNLQQHQPRVIGIDILRDIPIGEGREELISHTNKIYEPLEGKIKPIIYPCALPSPSRLAGIAPPPVIDLDSAVGFVNLDADKVNLFGGEIIRRMPISSIPVAGEQSATSNSEQVANSSDPLCNAPFSLSFLTALSYLQAENIAIDTSTISEGNIGLGEVNFSTLKSNAGGYQDLETGAYQIILDYQQEQPLAMVSLTEVLDNKISADLVKDKVVLIGYTTKQDIHQTPFGIKPGVYTHGWAIGQILSNVLDDRPQIWYWSEASEWLWIAAWGITGGAIALFLRPTWQMLLGEGIAVVFILGSGAFLFTQQGWIPIVPSLVNLAIATLAVKVLLPKISNVLSIKTDETNTDAIAPKPQANSPTSQPTAIESNSSSPERSHPTYVEPLDTQDLLSNHTYVESDTIDPGLLASTQLDGDTVHQSAVSPTHVESDESGSTYQRQDYLIGKILGNRYRLDSLLGQGGMSRVYLAADTRLENKTVAIKIMTSYSGNNNQALIKRFNREVKVISSLRSHNIVQVTDFGLTPPEHPFLGSPFYVMEYFHGETLGEVLEQTPLLPVNRTIGIMLQVCTGLKEAHGKGIVHRDLKPDNIFLATGGVFGEEAKILDFGIAKVVENKDNKQTAMTQHGSFIGTYRYASPEQCKGLPDLDRRTDIYSLGMILYEMLSGKNPYGSNSDGITQGEWIACHIRAEAQPLNSHDECQSIPDVLHEIAMKCLAKSPADRFQTIEELIEALKAVNPGSIADY